MQSKTCLRKNGRFQTDPKLYYRKVYLYNTMTDDLFQQFSTNPT